MCVEEIIYVLLKIVDRASQAEGRAMIKFYVIVDVTITTNAKHSANTEISGYIRF